MAWYDKVIKRENILTTTLQEKAKSVKLFPNLGLRVVKAENGDCFLVSVQQVGFVLNRRIVNYGKCSQKLNEKQACEMLKDFCFACLYSGITQKAQFDFDVLVSYNLPMKALVCQPFIEGLKAGLDQMKAQQTLAGKNQDALSKSFQPLYNSIDISVDAAKMQPQTPEQVNQHYAFLEKTLGL